MRPQKMTIQGFQGFRDSQEIDFSNLTQLAVTGRVGSGKSSIPDALTFALYSATRARVLDDVIHTACDYAEVVVEFTHNDSLYQVKRTVGRKGKDSTHFFSRQDPDTLEWVNEGDQDGRVTETSNAIRRVLGLSLDAYRASLVMAQNDSESFVNAKNDKRHELLTNIIGLDEYPPLAASAAEHRKNVNTEITRTQALREERENHVAVLPEQKEALERLKLEIAGAATGLKEAKKQRAALTKAQKALDARRNEARTQDAARQQRIAMERSVEVLANSLRPLEAERKALEANQLRVSEYVRSNGGAFPDVDALDVTVASLKAQWKDAKAEDRDVNAQRTSKLALHKQISTSISALDSKLSALHAKTAGQAHNCYACGQGLTDELHTKMVGDLTEERDSLISQKQEIEVEGKKLAARIEELAKTVTKCEDDGARAAEALGEARAMIDLDASVRDRLPSVIAEHARVTEELELAKNQVANLPEVDLIDVTVLEREERELDRQVKSCEQQISELETTERTAETRIAVAEDRISELERAKESIAALTAKLREQENERDEWTLVHEACSPHGIPRLILEKEIVEINLDLAQELNAISGGTLSASLSTERELKNGNRRSEITLTVSGQDGERAYETFSGGQRFLVNLALHLALFKALARRNGSGIDFFVIDEGWGSIEGEEREAALRVLHQIADTNDTLLMAITHVDAVAESFPMVLNVEMIGGTSTIGAH